MRGKRKLPLSVSFWQTSTSLFAASSLGYAVALYVLYPKFHEAVLFFAFRLRAHEETHVTTAFTLVLVCITGAAMVRDGIYAFANTALLITFYIPLLVLAPYFAPELIETVEYWCVAISSLILSGFGLLAPRRSYLSFRGALSARSVLVISTFLYAVVILAVLVSFRGIMSMSFQFEIYEQRAIYTQAAGLSAYLLNWLLYVVAPIIIILGVRRQSLILLVLGISGELLVFLVSGAKLALVIALMVPIFAFNERFAWVLASKTVVATLGFFALIFSYVMDQILTAPVFGPLIADRTLYAHGITNLMIIEHFADKPFNYWSTSFLRAFQEPVYTTDPFILVGESYFINYVRANTNFFGDGIINLGATGALIMTIVTAICLLISQSIFNRHDMRMRVLFVPSVLAITNGPIQVVIVTAGLGFIWVLLLVMRRSVGPTPGTVSDSWKANNPSFGELPGR